MRAIVNYHVTDPKNIGDMLSAPARYFSFPGYSFDTADIRTIEETSLRDKHLIVGGGGLLFYRFLESFQALANAPKRGKLILWGAGQQFYGAFDEQRLRSFDYSQYLNAFDQVGIRDNNSPYSWVPCVSCMHPAFDQKREIRHKFVVFSHKKFQIKIDSFPRMTNETQDIETVLNFLGSGETILTSSFHGAYWGTLLGRKVLAFPFSSKFHTLKHTPVLYASDRWTQDRIRFYFFNKLIYEFRYENKYSCNLEDWQIALKQCQIYPTALEECRARNRWYYDQVLQLLNCSNTG